MGDSGGCFGVYGFRVTGVDGARELLVEVPPEWPALEVGFRRVVETLPTTERIDDYEAHLRLLSGGSVHLDRSSGRVVFSLPTRPSDRELVHPYLAGSAAVAARWLGRESFHAGAFVLDGGAWALLGDKEAGKSSTLGWLARDGLPILTDDVLVLDGELAMSGPRSIDLREDPARELGTGTALGRVGIRDRWRVTLPAVAAAVPLRGWVVLSWGDETEVMSLRGGAKLRAIASHRTVNLMPRDPGMLVALSALPCYELRRPRSWASMRDCVERLVATLRASGRR